MIYVWMSRHELNAGAGSLFIAKYVDSIRKQAALIYRTGSSQTVVAYFRDEAIARDIAEQFFGGVQP